MSNLIKSCEAMRHFLGYQSVEEGLNAKLSHLDALLTVAVSESFLEHDKSVIYNYLWLVNDVVKQAQVEFDTLM